MLKSRKPKWKVTDQKEDAHSAKQEKKPPDDPRNPQSTTKKFSSDGPKSPKKTPKKDSKSPKRPQKQSTPRNLFGGPNSPQKQPFTPKRHSIFDEKPVNPSVEQMNKLTENVEMLRKIVFLNMQLQGQDMTEVLSSLEGQVQEAVVKLSPKKSPRKVEEYSEAFYAEELFNLQTKYNAQVKKCQKKGFNFMTSDKHGLPSILKAAKAISSKIGDFEPKSKKEVHQFHAKDIDRWAETYFDYIKDPVFKSRKFRAIETPAFGNCLPEAINLALNGCSGSQIYEIRLRGAIYYLENSIQIHRHGTRVGWSNSCDMLLPFERLVEDGKSIDACGVYAIAKATNCSINIWWPTIKIADIQHQFMSGTYNENGEYSADILWASAREDATSMHWEEQLFVADHFTVLANEDLKINRLKPEKSVVDLCSSSNDSPNSSQPASVTEETVQSAGEFDNQQLQQDLDQKLTLDDEPIVQNDLLEHSLEYIDAEEEEQHEEGGRAPKEEEQQEERARTPREDEQHEERARLPNEEAEMIDVFPDAPVKYLFREWHVLLDAAIEAKANEVLPNLKNYAGTDKNGQIFIVDFSSNIKKHLSGQTMTHHDFEGQWNGKRSSLNFYVYTRDAPGQKFRMNNDYYYKRQSRLITFNGTPVDAEFYLNALVLMRYKCYHGKSINYQRKITAFLRVPPDMDQELLNRSVFEYMGTHPGFKPHKNRKVNFLFTHPRTMLEALKVIFNLLLSIFEG